MTTTPDIGTTSYTMPTDRDVVATRVFDAPAHLVYEAYTSPKYVPQWLLGPPGWSMPVCEIDLRVGGKWRYMWRNDENGAEFAMSGVYTEIVANERVTHTESLEGQPGELLNTVTFEEQDGRTTVVTTMRFESQQIRDAALATGMNDGADISYDRLDGLLAQLT